MNNIVQILKKTGLFLFGVLLVIWGYKVNAANTEEKAKEEKEKNTKEVEQPIVLPPADEPKTEEQPVKEEVKSLTAPAKVSTEKKKAEDVKPKASTTPQTKKASTAVENKKENQTEEKKVEEVKQTVIEKATPEESSGTE
ncbi:hypothetical protein [uncultured Dysgonomonas sp.]|uniref:hypothetical protein n=1 Tax=Dysgonomonas mossii TaxID=163665 RepID=UPI0028038784|nr:hypothetical protein [uncultured Dysgonomonas sp.]